MNKYYVSIAIETEDYVSRDDMVDYFTTLMFNSDACAEEPFDPKGVMINSSTTSTAFDNGYVVWGTIH